jgi:hypothetical protein
LDSLGVTDFEEPEYKSWILKESKAKSNQNNSNENKSKIFSDIYSKPANEWLLK